MRADSVAQAARLWFRSVHRRDACATLVNLHRLFGYEP